MMCLIFKARNYSSKSLLKAPWARGPAWVSLALPALGLTMESNQHVFEERVSDE